MSDLITISNPHSAAAEAFQSLRTNLEFSGLEQPLHTLLVTSPSDFHRDPADKSRAVANLAVTMAQTGDRVVVVDGDLRRPQQHALFGVANSRGLADWLNDGQPVAPLATEIDNLRLLPAGPTPGNPVALLSRNHLVDLLAALREEGDYVVIDAPPLLAVTDAALWASKVDGTVLLLEAGRTQREHAQRAKSLLEKVGARIVGAVLLNAERDAAMAGYGA